MNTELRVFLVDDEPPARGMLRLCLDKIEGITIVGEAGNPFSAIDEINRLVPDLLFLDIEMPLLNGFDMLPYLTCEPMVIFCTAYEEFAIRAFEVNALDYVLKPVTPERLRGSLKRANTWGRLRELKDESGKPRGLEKVMCTVGNQHVTVWAGNLRYLNKEDRYTLITTDEGKELLTRLSIGYLAEHLDETRFFQVNRSLIIHKSVVLSYKHLDSGNLEINVENGDVHTVSRRRAKAFKEWFLD